MFSKNPIKFFVVLVFALNFSSVQAYTLPSGETLSDPTKPAVWKAPKKQGKKKISYKLNYVFSSDNRKRAIVNGKTVSVGDKVSGAKVLAISDSSVSLLVDGQRKSLTLKSKKNVKKLR